MTIPELDLYTEIINLTYGEDYVTSFEEFSELLKVEFDVDCSVEDLKFLYNMNLKSQDVKINLKLCGVYL